MRIAIPATLALIALATTALAVDVTTPGQTVVDGEVGVLTTDRVCAPPNAIYLGNAATLDLVSQVKPRRKNSTCGTSAGTQASWGVCAND